ncbi:alpha-2-macroglobulin family protein [Escherichia coli]|nr:alpha-2-macroglobulin family protein [Escherichia coli]
MRVMAQAWTADDFGSSEDKVVVAAPVIAELNTPRFLASGDTTRLALDISNLTDKPQTLQVHLTASGLLVTVQRGSPAAGAIGARGAQHAVYPVSALAGYGDGQVNATISGLSLPDETFAPLQKQWKIGVRPAYPAQTVKQRRSAAAR